MINLCGFKVYFDYQPTPCATCYPYDILDIYFNVNSFAIYKTICDIAGEDALAFYDNNRNEDGSIVGIQDRITFYFGGLWIPDEVEDMKMCFRITDGHKAWDKFQGCEEEYLKLHQYESNEHDQFMEEFEKLFDSNKDFTIKEDDLKMYPVWMEKVEDHLHVTIRKATDSENKKLVYVKKGNPVPEFEYDKIEWWFDEYEEWPYRKPLNELIYNWIDATVDLSKPFHISFYETRTPYHIISGGFLYINPFYPNISISKEELKKVLDSIDFSSIIYSEKWEFPYDRTSNPFSIYNKEDARLLIEDALKCYML